MRPLALRVIMGVTMLVAILLVSTSCEPPPVLRYTLAITTDAHGAVTPASGAQYDSGTVVALGVTAAPGWIFCSWQGADGPQVVGNKIVMDSDKTIEAVFEQLAYPLTLTVQGGGTVQEHLVTPKGTTYADGSVVELTPAPSPGWAFSSWRGANGDEVVDSRITMDASKAVTAVFVQMAYTLTVSVQGEGSVQQDQIAAAKGITYDSGSVVRLTPVARAGWVFSGWQGAGASRVADNRITMDADAAITAVFEQPSYPLTITVQGGGTVQEQLATPKGTTYIDGSTVVLTPMPSPGWVFSHWSGDLTGGSSPASLVMTKAASVGCVFVNSASGKIVFWSAGESAPGLYAMNPDGTGAKRLTTGPTTDYDTAPRWSPDASQIAFSSSRDGGPEIYVMDADGMNARRLTYSHGPNCEPSWSPDGSKIVFSSGGHRSISVMGSDGSAPTTLWDGSAYAATPSWSPDGRRIAFSDGGICVIDANGTGEVVLTQGPRSCDSSPSWSPDGKRIAFSSERGSYDGTDEVYVMNADGTGQTRLTYDSSHDLSPTWSPDGSMIAFGSCRDPNPHIYVMSADGSGQTRLTSSYYSGDVSPDWSSF